ncbi:hypothetical protein JOF56_011298 [Kibdelosporangium banguiense]|uniref:Uncharacterized protein n=1 Tax=Kibdelosporangium banguiense TaxID=1365924 RepID=A0ABS4U2M5_9PSEU|nr:hypothetical protein [Kibdelosporangium banguiense]MBP2330913.1 hypothetical protein [Kibdelosporangium banguiense]
MRRSASGLVSKSAVLAASWAHFTEGRDELVAAFTAAGLVDRLELG